jgi:hypothetical protein
VLVRHQLVHLVPADSAMNLLADELDSHLYQSVATQFLPYIAEALGLPLYTRIIKGKAIERGPEYGSRVRGGQGSGHDGDETEDLTALLEEIMVSSGVVLTDKVDCPSGSDRTCIWRDTLDLSATSHRACLFATQARIFGLFVAAAAATVARRHGHLWTRGDPGQGRGCGLGREPCG